MNITELRKQREELIKDMHKAIRRRAAIIAERSDEMTDEVIERLCTNGVEKIDYPNATFQQLFYLCQELKARL